MGIQSRDFSYIRGSLASRRRDILAVHGYKHSTEDTGCAPLLRGTCIGACQRIYYEIIERLQDIVMGFAGGITPALVRRMYIHDMRLKHLNFRI